MVKEGVGRQRAQQVSWAGSLRCECKASIPRAARFLSLSHRPSLCRCRYSERPSYLFVLRSLRSWQQSSVPHPGCLSSLVCKTFDLFVVRAVDRGTSDERNVSDHNVRSDLLDNMPNFIHSLISAVINRIKFRAFICRFQLSSVLDLLTCKTLWD